MHDGLEDASLLLCCHREKSVSFVPFSLFSRWSETRKSIVIDRYFPPLGKPEISSVWIDGIEHTALIPAGPVMVRTAMEKVGLLYEMMGQVIQILDDAFSGEGKGGTDLESTPDNRNFRRPLVRKRLHVRNAVDHIRLEMGVCSVCEGKGSGHEGEQFHLRPDQGGAVEGGVNVAL